MAVEQGVQEAVRAKREAKTSGTSHRKRRIERSTKGSRGKRRKLLHRLKQELTKVCMRSWKQRKGRRRFTSWQN